MITDLPYELIVLIITFLSGNDVITLSKTCSILRELVSITRLNGKSLYVRNKSQFMFNDRLIYGFDKYIFSKNIIDIPDYTFNKNNIIHVVSEEIDYADGFNGCGSLTVRHVPRLEDFLSSVKDISKVCIKDYYSTIDSMKLPSCIEKLKIRGNYEMVEFYSKTLISFSVTNLGLCSVTNYELPSLTKLKSTSGFIRRVRYLDNLEKLIVTSNGCELSVKKLPKLKYLDISNTNNVEFKNTCQLETLIADFTDSHIDVSDMFKLTHLSCYSSSNITGYYMLNSLTYLNVSNCNISTLEGLGHIRKIIASYNNITHVPYLSNTEKLNVSNNDITTFESQDNLIGLNVSYNPNLETLPTLPSLRKLDVSDTKIYYLKNLPELVSLVAHKSHVNVSDLTTLKSLDVSKGRVDNLRRLRNLKKLNVSNTGIRFIKGLDKVEKLYAIQCRFLSYVDLKSLKVAYVYKCKRSTVNYLARKGVTIEDY